MKRVQQVERARRRQKGTKAEPRNECWAMQCSDRAGRTAEWKQQSVMSGSQQRMGFVDDESSVQAVVLSEAAAAGKEWKR